jgi:hypothetical protein
MNIYSIFAEDFPTEKQYTECTFYRDLFDEEWKIAVVSKGLVIAYCGDLALSSRYFDSVDEHGERMLINNSNCFFIQGAGFDDFVQFRKWIKERDTITLFRYIQLKVRRRILDTNEINRAEVYSNTNFA